MKRCKQCGKKMPLSKRRDALFCSAMCRKAASRQKAKVEDEKRSRTLTAGEHADMMRIHAASPRAYKSLIKMLAVYGKGYTFDALNMAEQLMYDLTPEKTANESIEFEPNKEM